MYTCIHIYIFAKRSSLRIRAIYSHRENKLDRRLSTGKSELFEHRLGARGGKKGSNGRSVVVRFRGEGKLYQERYKTQLIRTHTRLHAHIRRTYASGDRVSVKSHVVRKVRARCAHVCECIYIINVTESAVDVPLQAH